MVMTRLVGAILALALAACGPALTATAPSPAPGGTVTLLDGTPRALTELLAADRPTLLVFMTRWCKVCEREQPDVERWAREHRSTARTVVVVSGSPAADALALVRERGMATDALEVVADPDGALADSLGVRATPTLLLFGPGGTPEGTFHRIDALPGAPALVPVTDTGAELGTSYDVMVLAPASKRQDALRDLGAARDLVRELGAMLSEWRPDSEVSRVNDMAARGPVRLSPTLHRILAGAIHVSRSTGGAFDVTWRPLDAIWDEAERTGHLPDDATVAAALRSVGHRHLVLEDDTLRFGVPGMQLGLGGVAKGAIVDAAFLALRKRGYDHVIVNIGGDLRTYGLDERGARRIFRIADPYRPGVFVASIEVTDTAVATSGSYLRFRTVAGQRIGHIVDPRTGRPPPFDGSVTVLTRDAAMADALATALFVMGPDEGLAFARGIDGVDAIYVTREGVRGTVPVRGAEG